MIDPNKIVCIQCGSRDYPTHHPRCPYRGGGWIIDVQQEDKNATNMEVPNVQPITKKDEP